MDASPDFILDVAGNESKPELLIALGLWEGAVWRVSSEQVPEAAMDVRLTRVARTNYNTLLGMEVDFRIGLVRPVGGEFEKNDAHCVQPWRTTASISAPQR